MTTEHTPTNGPETMDAAQRLGEWLDYERLPMSERPAEHKFGWHYDPRNDVQSLLEQVQSLEAACDHHKMFWQKAEDRERGLKEQLEALRGVLAVVAKNGEQGIVSTIDPDLLASNPAREYVEDMNGELHPVAPESSPAPSVTVHWYEHGRMRSGPVPNPATSPKEDA